MTFQRLDNNAHNHNDHVTKKQLREVMRIVSAKHRRNRHSRQLGECKKVECHLCQFVFDHTITQRGETVVCPSCGVAFEIVPNAQIDSVRVSEIEKEVSQLHKEIEKRLPRKRENSVIGPLPLQKLMHNNHDNCCNSFAKKNENVPVKKGNAQFAYTAIDEHRVRSEVVRLACYPNSTKPSQIVQALHAQQMMVTEETDKQIDECASSKVCNHTPTNTSAENNTTNLLFQELKAGRKGTTLHFCVAGIFIGIIICVLIMIVTPESKNTPHAHVTSEMKVPMIVNELLANQTADHKVIVAASDQTGIIPSGFNNHTTSSNSPERTTIGENDVTNNSADLKKELDKTKSELDFVKEYYERVIQTQASLSQGSRQFEAESLLWEAYASAEKDPAQSTILALQAIQRFKEIGLDIPSNARWALNQSLAAQGLGISFSGFEDSVEAITVSQDGQWVLIAADNGNIWLWDLTKHDQTSEKFLLDTLTENVSQLSILNDLSWAICLTKNGNIRLWDLSLQYPSQQPFDICNTVYSLEKMAVSADGRWLVVSASDRQNASAPTILLWDLTQLAQQRQLPSPVIIKGHEKNIRSIAISKDSHWLASGSDDKTVRLYDLTSPNLASNPVVLQSHELEVNVVAFSPDGKWLASGGRDSIIRIWNIQNGQNINKPLLMQHHQGWVSSLEFSNDNKYLAAGSYDRTISIWRFNTNTNGQPELAHVLHGHRGAIKSTIFSAHGDLLVSHGYDREVHVWNLLQGNPSDNSLVFRSMPTPFSAVQLTNDGRWLVLAQEKGKPGLRLWPLQFEETLAYAINYAKTQYTDVLASPTTIASANKYDYSVPVQTTVTNASNGIPPASGYSSPNTATPPIHQASSAQATNR